MEDFDFSGYQTAIIGKDWPRKVLREKRVVAGMTQQQVADKAKIVLQQYQKFESGERNIMTASFQMACRVIEALDMNVSDFYHGEYVFGEKVMSKDGVLCYEKTGKPIDEDVE